VRHRTGLEFEAGSAACTAAMADREAEALASLDPEGAFAAEVAS
jgi:hypothetical protein